jgi:DNA polymerase III epsilon subunit-like protein
MSICHVIDFEGNKNLGISEFGVVTLQNFEIISTHTEICQNTFNDHLEYFLNLRRTGLFAAHSAQIEDGLLRHYWASPGQVPVFTDETTTLSWGPWVDTKVIHRELFKNLKSYELEDLIFAFELHSELVKFSEKYCLPWQRKFHCALFDALATAMLIQNLQKYFQNISLPSLVLVGKN